MDRIEINVITGERKVVELTAEEVSQAQAQYAQWQINEAERKAKLETTLRSPVITLISILFMVYSKRMLIEPASKVSVPFTVVMRTRSNVPPRAIEPAPKTL